MKKKLILSLNEDLIGKPPLNQVSERISRLSGKINLPLDFDSKEELRKSLESKHIK